MTEIEEAKTKLNTLIQEAESLIINAEVEVVPFLKSKKDSIKFFDSEVSLSYLDKQNKILLSGFKSFTKEITNSINNYKDTLSDDPIDLSLEDLEEVIVNGESLLVLFRKDKSNDFNISNSKEIFKYLKIAAFFAEKSVKKTTLEIIDLYSKYMQKKEKISYKLVREKLIQEVDLF